MESACEGQLLELDAAGGSPDVGGPQGSVWLLCVGSFLMANSLIWWVALPFVIKWLDGSDTHVGLCLSLNMGTYTICCIFAIPLVHRFNPKRMVQLGAIGSTLAVLGMMAAVYWASNSGKKMQGLWILDACVVFNGVSMVFFWPSMMAWVSHNWHGRGLNRRLGQFNMAWSAGAVLAPFVGGYLVEIHPIWPFIAVVGVVASSLTVLSFARRPVGAETEPDHRADAHSAIGSEPLGDCFLWMSRVALVAVWVANGLFRSQFGLLLKLDLHYTESDFGVLSTCMSGAMAAIFIIMGRNHIWQYKGFFLIGAQALVLQWLLLAYWSDHLAGLAVSSALIGLGLGFLYASHLCYGLARAGKRVHVTAMHEALLGVGLVTGSLVGGWLSDTMQSRRAPYVFGVLAMVAGLMIQGIIYWRYRRKLAASANFL